MEVSKGLSSVRNTRVPGSHCSSHMATHSPQLQAGTHLGMEAQQRIQVPAGQLCSWTLVSLSCCRAGVRTIDCKQDLSSDICCLLVWNFGKVFKSGPWFSNLLSGEHITALLRGTWRSRKAHVALGTQVDTFPLYWDYSILLLRVTEHQIPSETSFISLVKMLNGKKCASLQVRK